MDVTLLDQLVVSAEKFPHQPLISSDGLPITTTQLNNETNYIAAALRATGFEIGEVAAIYLPTSTQQIISYLGIIRAGGRVLLCDPLWQANEIMAEMGQHSAETLFTLSKFYPSISDQPTTPKRLIVTNIKAYFPRWKQLQFKHLFEKKNGHRVELSANAMAFSDFLKLGKKSPELFFEDEIDSAEIDLPDFYQSMKSGQLHTITIDPLFL